MFAQKSFNQNVEMALLKSWRPDAIFDRIFTITGHCDLDQLTRDLSRGLEERVEMMAVVGGHRSWSPAEERQPGTSVQVGVRFNQDTYNKVSSLGPVANCAEAEEFRQFWGERSELRRFQVRKHVVRKILD